MRNLVQSVLAVVLVLSASGAAVAQGQQCPGWRDPAGKKIVGGTQASLALWPSQAALRITSPDGKDAAFVCGGTAITRDWVLTAAHCFDDIARQADGRQAWADGAWAGWTLDVVLGTDDLGASGQSNAFPIAEVRVHEAYKRDKASTTGEDIALVRLSKPWPGPVATLSLDTATDPSAQTGAGLMVAGFGMTTGEIKGGTLERYERSDGGHFLAGSRRLLHVGLPWVPTPDCSARWPGKLVGAGQICAGFEAGAKDSCGGDSGGPLVMYDAKGCPTHVGLVSWGARDCAAPKTYGVYTRLSHHAAWLRRHVPEVKAKSAPARPDHSADLSPAEFVVQAQALLGGVAGNARIGVPGGATVKNGGTFAFEAQSEVPGRLIIIDVNADGVATQIFPNEFVADGAKSQIKAGEVVTVPGPGYGFDHFRAEPPLGRGRLIALVVPPDFPTQTLIAAPVRAKGFKPERSTVGYLMNLLQQIGTHVAAHRSGGATPAWAVATFEYEIVP